MTLRPGPAAFAVYGPGRRINQVLFSHLDQAVDAAYIAVQGGGRDREKLREAIRLAVRRVTTRWTGKKPIVDVLIIDA